MRSLLLTTAIFFLSLKLFAQSGSSVEVIQTGEANVADIRQEILSPPVLPGLWPVLSLQQDGSGNEFYAAQKVQESSVIDASQLGSENEMHLDVFDLYSTTELIQIGEENKLWFSMNSDFSTYYVQQGLSPEEPGIRNKAIIRSGGMDNWVYLSQVGQENDAQIQQHNPSNFVHMDQNGLLNEAQVNQFGMAVSFGSIQIGEANKLLASQAGEGIITDIEQSGQGNTAFLDMEGDLYVFANLVQKGNENEMVIVQSVVDGKFEALQFGDNNRINAVQYAIDVETRIEQEGNDNNADLNLFSDGGIFSASQLGDGNSIEASQNGTFSQTEIFQKGNGLSATVIQE